MTDWAGKDLADDATGEPRAQSRPLLLPIDEDAPISGHHPPPELAVPGAARPEHEWGAARRLVFPLLRPRGTEGVAIEDLRSISLAGSLANTAPIVRSGPVGLTVVYGLAAEGFAVLVNAEHVLAWGIDGASLHRAAMENLGAWSDQAEWVEERTEQRALLSSATGEGYDAARILLPAVRERVAGLASGAPAGTRVLVGLPERDLLVCAALTPSDAEFGDLFREFLAEQFAAAVMPIAEAPFELRGSELVAFAG